MNGRSGKLFGVNDYLITVMLADPNYKVEADGRIMTRVAETGRVFVDETRWRESGTKHSSGYIRIKYKGKQLQAHRVVFAALLAGKEGRPTLQADLVINHIDGNGHNNHPDNLELVTQGSNNTHRFQVLGHPPVIGNAKLTIEKVRELRADRAAGMTYKQISEKYGIVKGNISEIVNNKTWIE